MAYIRSLGLLSQSDALGPMPSASAESGSTSDSQDTSRTVATRTGEAVRLTARQAEMLDWILSGLFYWRLRDPWGPAWLALNFTLILRHPLYAAYDNDKDAAQRSEFWARRHYQLIFIHSFVWGLAPWMFMPKDD